MKKRILLMSMLLIFGLVGMAVAETNDTGSGNSTVGNVMNKSQNWTARCAAVDNRVKGRLAMYEENRDPHFSRFIKITELLNQAINKSYVRGYNTTFLDKDLITLNSMILKFQDDYALFIQKLNDTRKFTCGHSEGQYHAALNESKAQLKIVKQDAEDIKNFYEETVKNHIKDLREQRKEEAEKRRGEMMNKTGEKLREREEKMRDSMERVRNWSEGKIRNESKERESNRIMPAVRNMTGPGGRR